MINGIVNYVKSSIEEMKKVTWPTRKETYHYTLLVIGISIAMAIYLGAFDFIFQMAFQYVINR
ncbi:MAG: preprotein translocase subunit SecE [Patescibacteria group bacterium]